MIQFERVRLE